LTLTVSGAERLFQQVRDAVIVVDASMGTLVPWNPAAAQLFGYTAGEAIGLPIEVPVPDTLKARHRLGLAAYGRTGHGSLIDSGTPVELPARRKTGEEFWVELSLSPLEDAGGNSRFVLAIVRDAGARRRPSQADATRGSSLPPTRPLDAAEAGCRPRCT
jgi:PAS domain S-box-containing protein